MEVCLARHCADDDIVTPIFPARDDHRPRNYLAPSGEPAFFNHMTARQIRKKIGRKRFAGYFKFCFERHPVDKCLSHYAMLINSAAHATPDGPKSWDEYVDRGAFPNNYSSYTNGYGGLLVNKIYRYEEIDTALHDIREKTGLNDLRFDVFEKSEWRTAVIPRPQEVPKSQRDRIMAAFSNSLRFVPYD